MALSVALPSMRSAVHADPILNSLTDTSGSFPVTCGFGPSLSCIKTEPISVEENMEESSFFDTTYTELSTAFSSTFSQIKQGQTDLYQETSEPQAFSSWMYKHPEHWEAREVLDWVFYLTDSENFDGALFRGEAYNTLTGKQLCSMTLADFLAIDQHYGSRVYEIFQWLLQDANFRKPCAPETFKAETLGNVPDFAFLGLDVTQPHRSTVSAPKEDDSKLAVYLDRNGNEMKVSLDGLGLYDIDITITGKHAFDQIDDSDYNSGSDADLDRSNSVSSSEVFDTAMFSDEEESTDIALPVLDQPKKTHTSSSSSSDSGCEGDDRRPSTRRRQTSTSRGNHLWEFVRDLLKDTRFNPSLLKWEDREQGVFKFVQSEAVAQMWGRKKNNPGMTYEKLSRAMRFCRTAGYFDSVPKTGRFPKKLCFKFGHKAHGWQD